MEDIELPPSFYEILFTILDDDDSRKQFLYKQESIFFKKTCRT